MGQRSRPIGGRGQGPLYRKCSGVEKLFWRGDRAREQAIATPAHPNVQELQQRDGGLRLRFFIESQRHVCANYLDFRVFLDELTYSGYMRANQQFRYPIGHLIYGYIERHGVAAM